MTRRLLIALSALAIIGAATGWLVVRSRSGEATAQASETSVEYGEVVRTDLAESETYTGTIDYASSTTILNRLQMASGTLISIRSEGTVARRGSVLFRIDDTPVALMFGKSPAWRTLQVGVPNGVDVMQLERNLVALGFDPYGMTVDRSFTSATQAAVEDWQESINASHVDGVVRLGEIVFSERALRIVEHLAGVGDPIVGGAQVLTAGERAPVVTLSVDDASAFTEGDRVSVDLPGTGSVAATVASIGTASGGAQDGSTSTTVVVRIAKPERAADPIGSSARVRVTTRTRDNVLAVPVTALLAVQGGGYAVEVKQDTGLETVAVDPGLYDDQQGLVEIEATGLRPGDRVVVAGR